MEKYYTKDGEFNYIRYNSLPILADHVLDHPVEYYKGWGVTVAHNKPIGLGEVKQYHSVFVNADLIEQYIDTLANIKVSYHLITGNADRIIPDETIQRVLQTKLVTWTAHNCKKIDERFLQIPMGFTEMGPQRPNSFTEYMECSNEKLIPVIVTPFGATHNSRSNLNNLYGDGILNIKGRIEYEKFLTLLSISKYSCCPRGNALDSHRFVESILCNSIPIVMTSDLDPVYKEMGAIIVNDWNECKDIENLPTPILNRDVITMQYWQDKITEHQQKYEL